MGDRLWLLEITLVIALVIAIILCANTRSSSKFNDGVCPHCNEMYELCATYEGLKYYTCPECGQEVNRY